MKQNAKWTILLVLITLLALAFYVYITQFRPDTRSSNRENASVTKVQTILLRNMVTRYPPTPKEVVSFFAEITQCLYNEDYSDEDFKGLAAQLYELYDQEFRDWNPYDTYVDALRTDIETNRKNNKSISSYTVSTSTDVVYYNDDTGQYAGLSCVFNVRNGVIINSAEHRFLLRRADNGHWKILGWQLVDDE
jgi:hypothetical protein